MNLATCTNYSGHVVYSDGRLYQCHELIGEYATEAAAKSQATRRLKLRIAERASQHHSTINAITAKRI